MRTRTTGDKVIAWIEHWCVVPDGERVGQPVRLSRLQCEHVRRLYDNPHGPGSIDATGLDDPALQCYLQLMHFCGPRARDTVGLVISPSSDTTELSSLCSARHRAGIFALAKQVVELSPGLAREIIIEERRLRCPELGTVLKAA